MLIDTICNRIYIYHIHNLYIQWNDCAPKSKTNMKYVLPLPLSGNIVIAIAVSITEYLHN